MGGSFERKRREIQRSLHRRARIRKAYFKLSGAPKEQKPIESRLNDGDEPIDLSDPDSEEEGSPVRSSPGRKELEKERGHEKPEAKKLTKKQLASRRRAEAYHRTKNEESAKQEAALRRQKQKETVSKRTQRGQPRLGAQVGLLLDKIQNSKRAS